jgi:hypothetical protein
MRNHKTLITAFVLTLLGVVFYSMGFAKDEKKFIPGEDSGFYYTIKKGDTLWDLSQRFYHSKWDWPGLWEMNDDIKNPHRIYPGEKIRIFLRDKTNLKPKGIKIKKKAVPVKVEPSFSFSEMDHIGFLKKKAQSSFGSIIKEQDGNLMMSTNDIIYIKPSGKGTLVPGRIYHIFSTSIVDKKINGHQFKGIKHLIKAKVKVLEHKGSYVTGRITDSYRTVYEGDLIMAYHKQSPVLKVKDNPVPIDARVICSEDNNLMINDYQIAFIDIGKPHVKPGQIYTVFRKNELKDHGLWSPKKKEAIKLENLKSGKLIVLHTEDIASTVMILSSTYAIHPDDMVN